MPEIDERPAESVKPHSISGLPSRMHLIDLAAKLQASNRSEYLFRLGEEHARQDLRARGVDPDSAIAEFLSASAA